MYLGQPPSNDPIYLPEDCQPSEAKIQRTPHVHFDASYLWESASGSSTQFTLDSSTTMTTMQQHFETPSSFCFPTFLDTAMSRNPDGSGMTGTFDSAWDESQQGETSCGVHDNPFFSEMGQGFENFECRPQPIIVRGEAVPELHRREAARVLNSSLKRQTKSPKRDPTGRSKGQDQAKRTNQRGSSQTRTGSSSWGRGVYVRPRHPRVICPLCPDGHPGFRGDHEFRRHHERIHARAKRVWVVRDRSGSGLLSKCKACTSGRHYGVDYNATAHLKRQHFNSSKTPGVVAPDNIRDWIEAVEVKVDGEPRKRGKKGKGPVAKERERQLLESSEREEEVEQDSEKGEHLKWVEEAEEEEGSEVTSAATTKQGGVEIKTPASYVQQRAAEREHNLKRASELSTEALCDIDNWIQFDEHFAAFAGKTARSTDGATVVSQHKISHAAVSTSGSTMYDTTSPDLYDINYHLLQEHLLPHEFLVGGGGSTVSPGDLCMNTLGDSPRF